jgi:uncharacterized oxidoreductase
MPIFTASQLRRFACDIFIAAGATAEDARIVSDALVEANLVGHDSHGVLRIPEYVRSMGQGLVNTSADIRIVRETPAVAVVDGDWGFGQVVARKTMEIAIEKASQLGVGAVSVFQSCHVGRVGDYPLIAAERGMAAIMFVNTHGGGKLVAPWGGSERRLSANPISVAIPRSSGPPILVDISTSAIAEGKVRHMLHRNVQVPSGCIVDAQGRPSVNAADLYGPPPGALLPFGEHKGFALGLVTDILAGAISGAGCSRPTTERVGNSFLVVVIDVRQFRSEAEFQADVEQLIDYIKSSKLAPGFTEILVPGEPEMREHAQRGKEGITVDAEAWRQIAETAARYGVHINQSGECRPKERA